MNSTGQQDDAPTANGSGNGVPTAQNGHPVQHTGHVAPHGVAGFHHAGEQAQLWAEGSRGSTLPASMQLYAHTPGRVGTGDQPGNTGGSRTATSPPEPPSDPSQDAIVRHAPNNAGSTDEDLDHERPGGMSGGLGDR